MAHKVHPKAYRIRETNDWETRGYYKDPAKNLEEDFKIREFLRKKLDKLGAEKVEIERFPGKLNVIIHSARPGLIIGRGGEGVEQLRRELIQRVLRDKSTPVSTEEKKSKDLTRTEKGKREASVTEGISFGVGGDKRGKKEIKIEIREIRNPWSSAHLAAQWVAQQIERRVPYRKVLKRALGKIEAVKEIQGAKIKVSGRLNGAEIARSEWLLIGKLPLQTLRANIDYAQIEAHCTYGVIGIKVWMYKGEKF